MKVNMLGHKLGTFLWPQKSMKPHKKALHPFVIFLDVPLLSDLELWRTLVSSLPLS